MRPLVWLGALVALGLAGALRWVGVRLADRATEPGTLTPTEAIEQLIEQAPSGDAIADYLGARPQG